MEAKEKKRSERTGAKMIGGRSRWRFSFAGVNEEGG